MSAAKRRGDRKRGEKGAGTLRKKGGLHEYRFHVDGRRYSVYGRTVEECREKEINVRERIKKGTYQKNGNVTMNEYFEEYLQQKSGSVVEATIIHNRGTYARLGAAFGNEKVCRIEKRQIMAFREKLEKEINDEQSKLTTHGGNDILELLASILDAAVNDRIIDISPAAGVKRFRRIEESVRATTHRRLSPGELTAFMTRAEKSFYFNLFRFLQATGARIGEACALYWTDCNFDAGEIAISRSVTKTGGGRVKVGDTAKTAAGRRIIPMNDDIREILQAQRGMLDVYFGSNVSGLVFPSTSGGVARPSSIDTCIKGIAKAAGVEHFGAHAFRHTFASIMVDAGVAPEVLKNILGHANIRITLDTYYHANGDRMREAMEKVIAFKAAI